MTDKTAKTAATGRRTDTTRTAAAKTATKDRAAARNVKTAAQDAPQDGAPFVLTPDDVAATFVAVRTSDDGAVIRDRFGAPMIDRNDDGMISGAAMARAMGLTPTRAKSFRAWLRDKSLPRQVATADDAARIMRAYQSRGARPVLSTDDTTAA